MAMRLSIKKLPFQQEGEAFRHLPKGEVSSQDVPDYLTASFSDLLALNFGALDAGIGIFSFVA